LVLALAAITLLAACTSSPGGSPGPDARVPPGSGPGSGTVVWLADPTAETATDDVRQVLSDAFEQAYPSIRVQLDTGPTDTDSMQSVLVGRLSAGSPTPDVYEGDVIWPQSFAARHYALPLTDQEIPQAFWSSFGTAGALGGGAEMVDAMTYHGQHYGVPEFIDEGFLYYRKDLLARAGLNPPRTWEELASDALVLKHDHLPYQFVWQGDNYEGLTCDWYELMADAFGSLPPGVGKPASPTAGLATALDSRQALKALDYLRSLIQQGISPSNVGTFQETDADSAFDSGQAAFLRGWDSSYANATSSASSLTAAQVGVELPPTFAGNPGHGWSMLGGWGLFVNPYSKNRQAALTFVKWLAGPQAQRILATEFAQIPVNARVRDDAQVIAHSPVLRAAAGAWVVTRPATTGYALITKVISSDIHDALPSQGPAGEDPCHALVRAAHELDRRVKDGLSCDGPPPVSR
jgi:multiple sugar transport system substrate-binding protein